MGDNNQPSGLLLSSETRDWFKHWWSLLGLSWWRVAVYLVVVLLPLFGFWRDEADSPEIHKAYNAFHVLLTVPESWLICFSLFIFLLMTVEGSYRKHRYQARLANALIDATEEEKQTLATRIKELEAQLESPRLFLKLSGYSAEERGNPVTWKNVELDDVDYYSANLISNLVAISCYVTIGNNNRARTAIQQESVALTVAEGDAGVRKVRVNATMIDEGLLRPIEFANPVQGTMEFIINKSTSAELSNRKFSIELKDGSGKRYRSDDLTLSKIRPPLRQK